jgi:hypothetical protein
VGLDFGGLITAVRELAPTQISVSTAKGAINRAYQSLLRSRPGGGVWFALQRTMTFATIADKTGGTISLQQNSPNVFGVGTAFDATDVGKHLAVGSRQLLRIKFAISPTQLELFQTWGELPVNNTPYRIQQLRYAMPPDGERIIRLVGPTWPVIRRAGGLVDTYDPARQMRGEPLVFYEVEVRPTQSIFETHPLVYIGQQPVTQGATTVTVDITALNVGTSGYRVFVTPSWATNAPVRTGRTTAMFQVDFGVPAPVGGVMDWQVVIPGALASQINIGPTMEFEMWPLDEGNKTFRLDYKIRVDDLVADADPPLLAGEAVMWAASAEQCFKLYGRTGDQTWLAQAQNYQGILKTVMDSVLREDRRIRGSLPIVLDRDDYNPTWDQAWIANMRLVNSLAQPSLA